MKENDLYETAAKFLAEKVCECTCLDVHDSRRNQCPTNYLLPSIEKAMRSYANTLVAAAVSEGAKHIPHIYYDEQGGYLGCECGWKTYSRITWAEHIRAVTPESAAKELERIKNEARLEEHDTCCVVCASLAIPTFPENRKDQCDARAELEAAKEK